MFDYECWDAHEGEEASKDLTGRVEEAKALAGSEGRIVLAFRRLPGVKSESPPRHILVTCGEDHENVFRIDEGAPPPPVEGRRPTPEEKVAFAAAANLVPEKSLSRTQELAKFVFSSVAVIGTLLTGLGLFTDLGDVLENSAKLDGTPWPLVLAGLSLFFASVALWPQMKKVDLNRLDAVEGWYRSQILWRGTLVAASLILFSAAILVATFTGVSDADQPEKPAISGSWTGLGEEAVVKVAVKTEDVPEGWLMITEVYTHKDEAAEKRVFYDRTRPGADGEVAVAGEVQVVEDVKRVKATVRLYSGDENDEPEAESDLTLARG